LHYARQIALDGFRAPGSIRAETSLVKNLLIGRFLAVLLLAWSLLGAIADRLTPASARFAGWAVNAELNLITQLGTGRSRPSEPLT
jgi:hypothetical protein